MTMDCAVSVSPKVLNLNTCVSQFADIIAHTVITSLEHDNLSIDNGMQAILQLFHQVRNLNHFVYIVGNGGSAAVASHAAIDFINMNKIRAMTMLDPAVTTCISNDYGYAQVYSKQLSQFIEKEDVLVAISSSGKSQNILNAAHTAKNAGAKIITLSGFSENNPLRQSGDYNIWLNSDDYGQVEIGHAFIMHYLTDSLRVK